jgi:hypothetical protein
MIFGSVISAFIIGAGGAIMVGFASGNGKMNGSAWSLAVVAGALSAAKDYRSLMKLPPPPTDETK